MTQNGGPPARLLRAAAFLATYTFVLLVASDSAVPMAVHEFLDQAAGLGSAQTVQLHGVVTALWGDDAFFLQDGDAAVFALSKSASTALHSGDLVSVTGRYVSLGSSAALSVELLSVDGTAPRPLALKIGPSHPLIPRFASRLVEVRGRIVEDRTLDPARQIALDTESGPLLVDFEGPDDTRSWPLLKRGDVLKITGVLVQRAPHDSPVYGYRVLVSARGDLVILESKPWWATTRMFQAITLAAILLGAAGIWAILLRRQVSRHTERIRERFELETAIERRYRELFESATDVILTHDLDGRVTSFNPAGERVLGWRAEEIIGCPIESLMAPGESDIAGGLVNPRGAEVSPGSQSFHIEMQTRDGRAVPFEVNSWIEYQDGEPVGVQAICRDISQRLQAEEEKDRFERKLLETQKLESLGILAGGIAHDFNNLLTAVLGNASLARLEVPPNSPAEKSIEEIEFAAERAADLCSQMLAYSGQGRFVITRVNLTMLVMETLELIQASVSKRARLELHLAEHLCAVQGDATQLRQVVMNLVINGGEALGDGRGTVTVKTGVMQAAPEWIHDAQLAPDHWDGNYVFLEVSDTGCGMSPETLSRIFEPFFTTKFTGRGLGLAAVLGIVRGHRGALKVTSKEGEGSTFAIALPAVASAADMHPVESPQVATPKLSGKVLVIDDEKSVRRTISRVLGALGCDVLPAEDGTIAVELARDSSCRIDLVFLDLTMPLMDGVQTLQELRRLRPDLPVILMSGFAEAHARAKFGEHGLSGFLQKPFTMDEVRHRVTSVLAGRRSEVLTS